MYIYLYTNKINGNYTSGIKLQRDLLDFDIENFEAGRI
jgi:hypothetical protein